MRLDPELKRALLIRAAQETIYLLITTRFYDGDPTNNFYCRDRIAFDPNGRPTDPHWRGDFKG